MSTVSDRRVDTQLTSKAHEEEPVRGITDERIIERNSLEEEENRDKEEEEGA